MLLDILYLKCQTLDSAVEPRQHSWDSEVLCPSRGLGLLIRI